MKTSNFHKIMVLLLMLMVSGVGYAHDVEIDGIYYNLNSETKEASVTYKGDDAFDEDEYVGTITIPSTITYNETTYNVTSIGESAFWCCENLKSVTIPNCIKRIEDKAFGYSGIASISIPNSVESIGDCAFCKCDNITSVIIPESVIVFGAFAFGNCTNLKSVTFVNPNPLLFFIGQGTFKRCENLTEIILPELLYGIGIEAFMDCDALASITLPSSMIHIDKNAFNSYSTNSLTDVTCLSKNPPSIEDEYVFKNNSITVHVLPGCKAAYEAADYWKDFKIVEDAEATVIAVETRIICIGAVGYTDDCKERIDIARSLYDSLSKDKQALVSNYNVLTAAEEEYNFLAKSASGIANINSDSNQKGGKYLEKGKVVIVKNGKKFNVNGLAE